MAYHVIDPMRREKHGRRMNRSICMPSLSQSYAICIEYMKHWFMSRFKDDYFKSIYVDGKYVWDDFRTLSRKDLLKREKPSLAIVPTIDWEFDNDKIDSYPYGLKQYIATGKFKDSFLTDNAKDVHMGIGLKGILMRFNFKVRVETRAQQLDLYEYMRTAHRVGYSDVQDVDLDFQVPYSLMLQIAMDLGFDVTHVSENKDIINDIPGFLRYLNMHSALPFMYKHRTINGRNEFFLRMSRMAVNVRPLSLSADDGEREGLTMNNFIIELDAEVRFPAPKLYVYYSSNDHHLNTVYSAWDGRDGSVNTVYTFKATPIPDENRVGWPIFMSTSYEEDVINKGKPLDIDFSQLLQGDIGEVIRDTIATGVSPSIFCDLYIVNGGEVVSGYMDWETLTYKSYNSARSLASYIGIYVDMNYVNTALINKRGMAEDRITESKHPNSRQAQAERGERK